MLFGVGVACVFGLLFGSFGSVILSRRGESDTLRQASSILRGRSACPHCRHRLQAWDLIPVLSFLLQGGRCRYCRKSISWLYPILELGSAIIFGLIYWYFADAGLGLMLFWMGTGWILWLLLVYDVLWYEVHIPLVILGSFVVLVGIGLDILPASVLWGSLLFVAFFLLLYRGARGLVLRKYKLQEEGVGAGDVIISPYLGALFYAGLPSMQGIDVALSFVFFLMLSGGIGLIWYLIQNKGYQKKARFLKKNMADQAVPFLPAMILGVSLVVIFHKQLFSLFGFE